MEGGDFPGELVLSRALKGESTLIGRRQGGKCCSCCTTLGGIAAVEIIAFLFCVIQWPWHSSQGGGGRDMCPDAEAGRQVCAPGGGGRHWVRGPEDKERSRWSSPSTGDGKVVAGEVGSGQTMQSLNVLWEILEGEWLDQFCICWRSLLQRDKYWQVPTKGLLERSRQERTIP